MRLLCTRFQVLLELRQLGERRIGIGLSLARKAGPFDICRAQHGIMFRSVGMLLPASTFPRAGARASIGPFRTISLTGIMAAMT